MPKRSHKVPSLKEKVKVLNKERKRVYVETMKIYSKKESSMHDIMKKEKEPVLVLLSHLKL